MLITCICICRFYAQIVKCEFHICFTSCSHTYEMKYYSCNLWRFSRTSPETWTACRREVCIHRACSGNIHECPPGPGTISSSAVHLRVHADPLRPADSHNRYLVIQRSRVPRPNRDWTSHRSYSLPIRDGRQCSWKRHRSLCPVGPCG